MNFPSFPVQIQGHLGTIEKRGILEEKKMQYFISICKRILWIKLYQMWKSQVSISCGNKFSQEWTKGIQSHYISNDEEHRKISEAWGCLATLPTFNSTLYSYSLSFITETLLSGACSNFNVYTWMWNTMGAISEHACIHHDQLILEVIYFYATQSWSYYHCAAGLGPILQSIPNEKEDHCKTRAWSNSMWSLLIL